MWKLISVTIASTRSHRLIAHHFSTTYYRPYLNLEYVASTALPAEQTFFGGLKQIIKEHGWYPFIGLGSAILLSKEIFMINTEFVVAADFCILTFIAYVLGADKVNAFVTEERAKLVDEINSVFKAEREIYKAQLDSCQAVINTPKVIAEANAAFTEANIAVAKARDLTQRATFRDSIVQRLQAIKLAEEEAANQQREAIRAKAIADVMEAIKSAKVRASVLDEAIALVGATEDKTGEFTALSKAIEESLKKIKA